MEWWEIVISAITVIGGSSGFVSLYMAKPKRNGLTIENMAKVLDAAQEDRENMKKEMQRIKTCMSESNKRDIIKMRAINSAYRCILVKNVSDCPVVHTMREECDKNEGVCEVR